jgi:hypothetical protein
VMVTIIKEQEGEEGVPWIRAQLVCFWLAPNAVRSHCALLRASLAKLAPHITRAELLRQHSLDSHGNSSCTMTMTRADSPVQFLDALFN